MHSLYVIQRLPLFCRSSSSIVVNRSCALSFSAHFGLISSSSSLSGVGPVARCVSSSSVSVPSSSQQGGLNGIFSVYKPRNSTSREVVSKLKQILLRAEGGSDTGAKVTDASTASGKHLPHRQSRRSSLLKIGHGGTLDRSAHGLLIIGVGSGTKLLQHYLSACEKCYVARGQLGVDTNTHDLDEGAVAGKSADYSHITREALESYLATSYRAITGGTLLQRPPLYSALKQSGLRLSELARSGEEDQIDLEAKIREVKVINIRVLEFSPPYYTLSIQCGSGFYVRSLIRDIGAHFRCGSVMVELVRTKQSGFDLMKKEEVIDMTEVMEEWKVKSKKVCDDAVDEDHASSSSEITKLLQAASQLPPIAGILSSHGLECTRANIVKVLSKQSEKI